MLHCMVFHSISKIEKELFHNSLQYFIKNHSHFPKKYILENNDDHNYSKLVFKWYETINSE